MANLLYDTLFGRHAGKTTPFLRLPDGTTLTHDMFLRMAARYAHAMAAAGLVPGDRLAVQIEKSPEALAVYAACAQTGVIFLPLNTGYTASEIDYFIG
ncbi:MAG: malonyl-CoA/methylmalonyl-CoA synthetase, partial [Yoonia sp.]